MQSLLNQIGLSHKLNIHFNLPNSAYIEQTLKKDLGKLTKDGSLVVLSDKHTGRSADDRYIVKTETTKDTIWWENNLRPMSSETFSKLKEKVLAHLNSQQDLYITQRAVGAHKKHNIGARLVSTQPQYALFTNHLFREAQNEFNEKSDFTILHAPTLKLDPSEFQTRSNVAVVTCFDTNTTIICGTMYAGEIKKSMFSVMNFRLPADGILPMHAGASKLTSGASSVFFGLSGTGKTTLSTDVGTLLIGDDEHGLSDEGIFNFEGGCYAKTYKLSEENEPSIFKATNRFGALLENVLLDPTTCEVNYNSKEITENGRSSYPLSFIEDLEPSACGNFTLINQNLILRDNRC